MLVVGPLEVAALREYAPSHPAFARSRVMVPMAEESVATGPLHNKGPNSQGAWGNHNVDGGRQCVA